MLEKRLKSKKKKVGNGMEFPPTSNLFASENISIFQLAPNE
jgi:hypothetical protein